MEFSVRSAELTSLLEKKISNFFTSLKLDEIGRVVSVGDGIARVYGLNEIQAGDVSAYIPTNVIYVFFFLILILVFVLWILILLSRFFQDLSIRIFFVYITNPYFKGAISFCRWALLLFIFFRYGLAIYNNFHSIVLDLSVCPMMAPSGGAAGSDSSNSGWKTYLNLSEDSDKPEAAQPVPEEPGGQFFGPHEPSCSYLRKRIPVVLRSCQHRAVRRDFLQTIFEDLHLSQSQFQSQASAEKRLKIAEMLNIMSDNRDLFLQRQGQGGQGYYLTGEIHNWERGLDVP